MLTLYTCTVYTVRKDIPLCMTDDDITKLCRTKSLVKQREIVENLVQAIASDTFSNSVQGINIALSPLNVVGNTFEDSIFSWPLLREK